MRPTRAKLIAGFAVAGVLVAAGTAWAYQAIVARWGADPRGTLIAAATVGIVFFISMNLLLAWDERRRRRLGRDPSGENTGRSDGPQ
jgi:hypothetical protein